MPVDSRYLLGDATARGEPSLRGVPRLAVCRDATCLSDPGMALHSLIQFDPRHHVCTAQFEALAPRPLFSWNVWAVVELFFLEMRLCSALAPYCPLLVFLSLFFFELHDRSDLHARRRWSLVLAPRCGVTRRFCYMRSSASVHSTSVSVWKWRV